MVDAEPLGLKWDGKFKGKQLAHMKALGLRYGNLIDI
jgi:hypothetical protein